MFKSKYIDNINKTFTSGMSGGNPCGAAQSTQHVDVSAPFTMLPKMASPAFHANLPGPVASRFAQPVDIGTTLSDNIISPSHLGEFTPYLKTF